MKTKLFFTILLSLVLITSSFGIFALNVSTASATETKLSLDNPLGKENGDPRTIIGNIIKAMLGLVGSLALLMYIYGGFTWVTSGGNDEKVKKGKDMIVWATLGLVIIFFSYALVTFTINTITGEGGPDRGTGAESVDR